jgi:hypothetical protein
MKPRLSTKAQHVLKHAVYDQNYMQYGNRENASKGGMSGDWLHNWRGDCLNPS